VRHLIWDWNGTLFDDLEIVVESVNASLAYLGADPIDADGYRAHYRRPIFLFYEDMVGRPVPPGEFAEIDRIFHRNYHEALHRADLTADARDAVAATARAGASQSVLSMWWHDRLVPMVRRLRLESYMLAVDGHRGEPGETKDQHLAHHIDQLLSLFPALDREEMVVIGDITDDADAAAAVGVDCVLYDGGSQPASTLAATGVPVAATLVESVALALARG
jgi:phosphoglycolate phosphatase-like HAD superfamily hydrolase